MTVIILPQSRPTTKTHEFKGVSESGREVKIEVVAAVDIKESAILADLKASMPNMVELAPRDPNDTELGFFGIAGILTLFWFVLLVIVVVAMMVIDGADFMDIHDSYWPSWVPIAGDYRIPLGSFRLWVTAIPVLILPTALLFSRVEKNEQAALKVGR